MITILTFEMQRSEQAPQPDYLYTLEQGLGGNRHVISYACRLSSCHMHTTVLQTFFLSSADPSSMKVHPEKQMPAQHSVLPRKPIQQNSSTSTNTLQHTFCSGGADGMQMTLAPLCAPSWL